jgi:hypothetical protein
MSIRFLARVVSIAESQRLHHRAVMLTPFSPPVAPGDRDPFAGGPFCHPMGALNVVIEVPEGAAKELTPGQFLALQTAEMTPEEKAAVNAESTRLAKQMESAVEYGTLGQDAQAMLPR